jgi:hypothetical protein
MLIKMISLVPGKLNLSMKKIRIFPKLFLLISMLLKNQKIAKEKEKDSEHITAVNSQVLMKINPY